MKTENDEGYIEIYEQEQIQRKLTTIGVLLLCVATGVLAQTLSVEGSLGYIIGKVATGTGAVGLTFYIVQASPSIQRWWDARNQK